MAGERETRVLAEGTLRWVQAGSGTGGNVNTGWITAASPVSGLIGYVQAGFTFDRNSNYMTVSNRGEPAHHKRTQRNAVEAAFTILYGVTGDMPPRNPYVTASGFSVPMWHFEFKQSTPEIGAAAASAGTGIYFQFHNAIEIGDSFTEAIEGNSEALKIRALAAIGPASSGYLS